MDEVITPIVKLESVPAEEAPAEEAPQSESNSFCII